MKNTDHIDKYKFEKEYWGDCCNTFDEDQKHYVYAKYMGLDRRGYAFDVHNRSIIDIGGGPTSIMLKCNNLKYGTVIDPIKYPTWVYDRYTSKEIDWHIIRGEDCDEPWIDGGIKFDECWIYNCLQHTDNPSLIIENALSMAKTLRIFEWVDVPAHEGHPQEITKDFLDSAIGSEGKVVQLAESGCFGKAYYNIHTQK